MLVLVNGAHTISTPNVHITEWAKISQYSLLK